MGLLRSLFWVLLFVFFTFCFVVLFEHGTHEFVPGFKYEFARAEKFVKEFVSQPAKTDKKEKK